MNLHFIPILFLETTMHVEPHRTNPFLLIHDTKVFFLHILTIPINGLKQKYEH